MDNTAPASKQKVQRARGVLAVELFPLPGLGSPFFRVLIILGCQAALLGVGAASIKHHTEWLAEISMSLAWLVPFALYIVLLYRAPLFAQHIGQSRVLRAGGLTLVSLAATVGGICLFFGLSQLVMSIASPAK